MDLNSFGSFLVVGLLWGTTNAFMEQGTKPRPEQAPKSRPQNFLVAILSDIVDLFRNIKFVLPFILNQLASVLNNFVVAQNDLSIAVPSVNCITFIVTFITQKILNKQSLIDFKFFGGVALIMVGMYFCLTPGRLI